MNNEYRRLHGFKTIPGKPKGAKDTEQSRKNKSESSKNYLMVKHATTGKCERLLKEVALALLKSGEYVYVMQGRKNPHSEEAKAKFSEIAKNREKYYCRGCRIYIQGINNWTRHLFSNLHTQENKVVLHVDDGVPQVLSDCVWTDVDEF
jgi:hypothetical protein